MSAQRIYTKKAMHLDINVWFCLLIVIVLSSGLLGYKLINNNNEMACNNSLKILIFGEPNSSNKSYYTNQQILFRISASPTDKVEWTFGDDSKIDKTEGGGTRHDYTREGVYTVVAKINSACLYTTKINIRTKPSILLDSTGSATQPIIGRQESYVGEPVTFTTPLPASSYKWTIENSSRYPMITTKEATFTFKTSNTYTVLLQLDDDKKKKYRYDVTVTSNEVSLTGPEPGEIQPLIKYVPPPLPSKQEEKPAVQPSPNNIIAVPDKKEEDKPVSPSASIKRIADETFRDYLQAVVCGGFEVADFNKYLCNGGATNVLVGESTSFITFSKLCNDLKNSKKIKIDRVETTRDPNDKKCVIVIKVWYDKKGGLFGGKGPCN